MNIIFTTTKDGAIKASAVDTMSGTRARAMPLGERSEAGMAQRLQELGTPASGILPPGVRWVSASGRQVLFERPPRRTRFTYSPKAANQPEPKWRDIEIELPWTVYAIVFSNDYKIRSLTVYGARQSLRSTDDHLGLMPLSNTHADGHFCLPAGQPEAATLAEGIQNAYQMMWHSKFNMDVWDLIHQALANGRPRIMVAEPTPATAPKASRLLRRWEELTQEQVLAITDWPQMTTVAHVIMALNQYAVSSFTGWHLMSTAKQAFMEAPAKKGGRAKQDVVRDQFDHQVDRQRYVAENAYLMDAPVPIEAPDIVPDPVPPLEGPLPGALIQAGEEDPELRAVIGERAWEAEVEAGRALSDQDLELLRQTAERRPRRSAMMPAAYPPDPSPAMEAMRELEDPAYPSEPYDLEDPEELLAEEVTAHEADGDPLNPANVAHRLRMQYVGRVPRRARQAPRVLVEDDDGDIVEVEDDAGEDDAGMVVEDDPF